MGAVPNSISIARTTTRIAWQNVVFALAVKALVMVLGLAGYASMWMAVFADSGVAMLCPEFHSYPVSEEQSGQAHFSSPDPSLMMGLDGLLRRVRSRSDIFYSHECAYYFSSIERHFHALA